MPFLVGLTTNIQGNDVSAAGALKLPQGQIVMPYVYPIPPMAEKESRLGYIYYLLYEQNNSLNAVDTRPFSHPSHCSEDMAGR